MHELSTRSHLVQHPLWFTPSVAKKLKMCATSSTRIFSAKTTNVTHAQSKGKMNIIFIHAMSSHYVVTAKPLSAAWPVMHTLIVGCHGRDHPNFWWDQKHHWLRSCGVGRISIFTFLDWKTRDLVGCTQRGERREGKKTSWYPPEDNHIE